MPGTLPHLVARFFDTLAARPLNAEEQEWVRGWLPCGAAEVFFAQPAIDQRHGYQAAGVVAAESDQTVVIRAALLHDVGKRHAGLGVVGRSLASLLIRLHLPLPERARRYRDHGEVAAVELAKLGLEPLVVDFAHHHHHARPASVPEPIWELLRRADQPAKTRWPLRTGIT